MVMIAGVGWSIAFIVIALIWRLQLYADGAFFSYAIAVQDVWAFHWHNISGRLSVFLLTLWPAELLVGWTGSPHAGVMAYGALFYGAPLVSLVATFYFDRTPGRSFFTVACASTALLAPLVFGFPTEMWIAHALFWPTLTAAHCARQSHRGTLIVFVLMAFLILAHEGALVLACAVVASLAMRGSQDPKFVRGACVLLAALVLWGTVKITYRPDDYFAGAYWRAAFHFFDLGLFTTSIVRILLATLAGYVACLWLWRRTAPSPRAPIYAVLTVALCLAAYWLLFDTSLHASNRYYMRTLLVVFTPLLGLFAVFAVMNALRAERMLNAPTGLLRAATQTQALTTAFAGAFVLITLVHGVETAKFLDGWTRYKHAVQQLAISELSDPSVGDARFVSTERISKKLRPLSWFSTTPYLSIVLAGFRPSRIVVDPSNAYFWLDCTTATRSADAVLKVPTDARASVRIYSCQHR